jgi:hypothetical protein
LVSKESKKGDNGKGTPCDNNKLKKWSPCIWNPTIVIPIKRDNERPRYEIITYSWLTKQVIHP